MSSPPKTYTLSDYSHLAHLTRLRRGWAMLKDCQQVLLWHGALVLALCISISLVLWLLRPQISFGLPLGYSLTIGALTWLMIDGGRFFIDQDSPYLFPRGSKGVALITVGVLLGFVIGIQMGDALSGHSTLEMLRNSPETFTYMTLFSLAGGFGISSFFYTRGRHAYFLAALEAKSRQTAEAQLKLLQSQLDPHMLFNTLANLRALIPQEPDRAVQMLDRLNDFLRATLSASRASEHSLQAEFDRLRDYLELMQIRMGNRLRYELVLPADLAQQHVPALILQSLVENAIVHGLEPKIEGGSIRICAQRLGEQLLLQVLDDGLGCDVQHMTPGFGLTQVRERLLSRYGGAATIEFIANNPVFTGANPLNPSQNLSMATSSGMRITLSLPLPTPTA